MNDRVDSRQRNSQPDSGSAESDEDSWFPDRRTLAEKMDEAIEKAGAEIRRAFREAFESKD